MTIAEAVEIETGQNQIVRKGHVAIAKQVIVDRYLWLTDPKPLTVAVIEKELGEPVSRHGGRAFWMVGDRMFSFCGGDIYLMNVVISRPSTLGHLRQVVAMMKGGA